MNSLSVPENVEMLLRRIKEEVAHRRAPHVAQMLTSGGGVLDSLIPKIDTATMDHLVPRPDPLSLKLPGADPLPHASHLEWALGNKHHVNDLLCHDDLEFINVVYRIVLEREVDTDGLKTYLSMLRDGAPKIEIIGRLRYSAEGRLRNSRITGLSRLYWMDRLARIPVIGKPLAVVLAIWNLPDVNRMQRRFASQHIHQRLWSDAGITESVRSTCDALKAIETAHNEFINFSRNFAAKTGVDELHKDVARLIEQASSKPDWGDLEKLALESNAATSAIDQDKISRRDFIEFQARVESLGTAVEDIRASNPGHEALLALRNECELNTRAKIEEAVKRLHGSIHSKADKASVDWLRRQMTESIQRTRLQWNDKLEGVRAAKIDSCEFRALDDRVDKAQHATVRKVESLADLLADTQAVLASVGMAKADRGELTELKTAVEHRTEVAIDQVLDGIEVLKRDAIAATIQAHEQCGDRMARLSSMETAQTSMLSVQQQTSAALKEVEASLVRVGVSLSKSEDAIAVVSRVKADTESLSLHVQTIEMQMRSAAERASVHTDAVKREIDVSFELALKQWSFREERILASMAAKTEVYGIVDQNTAALRVANDELRRLDTSLLEASGAINNLQCAKADREDLSRLQSRIDDAMEDMQRKALRQAGATEDARSILELLRTEKTAGGVTDTTGAEAREAVDLLELEVNSALSTVNSSLQDLKRNVLDHGRRVSMLLEDARKRAVIGMKAGE